MTRIRIYAVIHAAICARIYIVCVENYISIYVEAYVAIRVVIRARSVLVFKI